MNQEIAAKRKWERFSYEQQDKEGSATKNVTTDKNVMCRGMKNVLVTEHLKGDLFKIETHSKRRSDKEAS